MTEQTLDNLTRSLVAALRRDAQGLDGNEAPDLARLADQLDRLLDHVQRHPGTAARRALIEALESVEAFKASVEQAHASTAGEIRGASHRRLASRAYVQAERYAGGRS